MLDAEPAVMCMELGICARRGPDDLDLDPDPRVATLAELNDAAYGTTPDMSRALRSMPGVVLYVARVDGRPASCLGTHDLDGDCCILYVATAPRRAAAAWRAG